MPAQSYTTAFSVDRAADEVFDAVADPRRWWNVAIEGGTDAVGDEFLYEVPGVHRARIRVTEVVPGERLTWQVLDNWFGFIHDQTEWVDTRIRFELHEQDGTTEVRLTHDGLTQDDECYDVCQDAWSGYVQGSLRDLIETGTGAPSSNTDEELLQARQHVGLA